MAHVPKKITEIYVFVVTEVDGGEGIPAWSAIIAGQRTMVPMIAADTERMKSLRDTAQFLCDLSGQPMRVYRFTGMEQIDTVTPKKQPKPENN